ncbi:unnamed protein product [Oppiella nova]|uniref:Fatty acid desaturase domain-containing protein n=1 Tax=Oppiella nova TaxID=334625 RepID=A0A7R9LQ63_9ACAR|nr:unnamed protein product [Oppiella nova]CAG2165820.1 unnamed protein product [Oppiella nova]
MPPFNNNTKDFQRSGSQTMTTNGRNALYGVWCAITSAKYETVIWMFIVAVSASFGILSGAHRLWTKYETVIWMFIVAVSASFGILSGAHRLWSHKCYKAHSSLRILLMILQTLALQNDIYEWSRDHRVHHKYSETDADPHNSNRGFFFAHMDWLMTKKHPQVIEKGRQLDMSDLLADTVVRFQRKYYVPLVLLIWGVLPTVIPYYLWSEGLLISFASNMLRYVLSLHQSWLVNSAAHLFGFRPYDKGIASRENQSVVYLSFGEGYHNYHHTFPYDYSASEFGWKSNFNLATAFIDFFAMLGLAYDLKKASDKTISERQERTGEKIKGLQKNTLLDYMIGLVITIWPLWVTYISRTIYRYFFENVSYVY